MYLYKYFNLDEPSKIIRLLRMITKGEVWFSEYHNLNDPMEGIYYQHGLSDENIRYIKNEKEQRLIGCFGKTNQNKTLWSYYANGFSGCCVKFDILSELKDNTHEMSYISEKIFCASITPQINKIEGILNRKLKFWKNENETRMIVPRTTAIRKNYIKVGKVVEVTIGLNLNEMVFEEIKNCPTFKENSIKWNIMSPITKEFNKNQYAFDDFLLNFDAIIAAKLNRRGLHN